MTSTTLLHHEENRLGALKSSSSCFAFDISPAVCHAFSLSGYLYYLRKYIVFRSSFVLSRLSQLHILRFHHWVISEVTARGIFEIYLHDIALRNWREMRLVFFLPSRARTALIEMLLQWFSSILKDLTNNDLACAYYFHPLAIDSWLIVIPCLVFWSYEESVICQHTLRSFRFKSLFCYEQTL